MWYERNNKKGRSGVSDKDEELMKIIATVVQETLDSVKEMQKNPDSADPEEYALNSAALIAKSVVRVKRLCGEKV